jgi:outer membrane receptor protein involved in Fe transport
VTDRYSVTSEWQRGSNETLTRVTAYALAYRLDLFSNFTFFLDDPVRGDQKEQTDRRIVTGGKVSRRSVTKWAGHSVQNTVGVQLRNDDIGSVALYHTERRVRLSTLSQATVIETTGGVFGQNDVEWADWLRTSAGVRADGSRYQVTAPDPENSGTRTAALVSPKASVTLGPWRGTELYFNAGEGFHSNDARGTTISRDAYGNPVDRVTPLVRAKGAEIGLRTVALPHLQSTLSWWTLRLGSELVYNGDEGSTEPGPASDRHGVEWSNYYALRRWLVFDGDLSWSHAEFTNVEPAHRLVPEAVGTVISAGASVDDYRRTFGSVRLRYFGPRPLVDDGSVRSKTTSLVNAQAGYKVSRHLRATLDVFNVFDAKASDIDYYFASRLPGEPVGGVYDVLTHPTPPRTARLVMSIGF